MITVEYSGSNPFVWSQSINWRKASFSGIAPEQTHNKWFIITIYGGGYPFKNYQTWLKLNFTWDTSCNRFVCVCVSCGNKSSFLIPDKIHCFKPLFQWKHAYWLCTVIILTMVHTSYHSLAWASYLAQSILTSHYGNKMISRHDGKWCKRPGSVINVNKLTFKHA